MLLNRGSIFKLNSNQSGRLVRAPTFKHRSRVELLTTAATRPPQFENVPQEEFNKNVPALG